MKLKSHFLLSLCFSLTLLACKSGEKKAEEPTSTDNTVTVPAETTTPTATEETIDAVKVAPNYYKVLSDSLGIRVLEATYKPGDSSVMHSHPNNAMYVIQGGMAEFVGKDGQKMNMELKTGMSAVRGNDYHSVKNVGKTTMKVLLVEVNRPSNVVPQDAATDATKVAADEYKLLHDSLGIRIIEVNYKPGQVSNMHSHPDLAVYVVNGGKAELTEKDGKKNKEEVKPGMAWISAADTHSGHNVGSTPFKLLLFEVNRPRN